MTEIAIGAECRAKCTAPARYIGHGFCLYVSSQHNGIMVNPIAAYERQVAPSNLPLPSDEDVEVAALVLSYAKRHP